MARQALALRFHLPYDDSMQDWEWEVADAARFEEFFVAYSSSDISEDEAFSLMEILLQCIEAMPDEEQVSCSWQAIESHLKANMSIHLSTIKYWACLGENDPIACFRVALNMRSLLALPADLNPTSVGASK